MRSTDLGSRARSAMAKRSENMLEAFRASAEVPDRPAPEKPKAPRAESRETSPDETPAAVGGPFADGERPLPTGGLEDEGLILPMGVWTFVAAQAALLGFVFLLGRLSADQVEAGARDGAAGFVLPPQEPVVQVDAMAQTGSVPPLSVADAPRTAADAAFLDPANRYSVLAITYPVSELAHHLANQSYRHLRDLDFAVITPRVRGSYLFVLVGASPTSRELEPLEQAIRNAPGPDGGKPYADAYRVNIEDYL